MVDAQSRLFPFSTSFQPAIDRLPLIVIKLISISKTRILNGFAITISTPAARYSATSSLSTLPVRPIIRYG